MDLDLAPASIELLSEPKPIFLNGDIILFLQTIWYVKRILYIAMLCVFCLFYNEMLPRKWFALYFNVEGNPNICSSIFPRV